jgi:hypothetical protein
MAAAVALVVGAAYVAPGRLTQSCVLMTSRSGEEVCHFILHARLWLSGWQGRVLCD